MGRAEKYANVIDKYEEGVEKLSKLEKEEKLSVTREVKFDELQKNIDNSITIADLEDMEGIEEKPKKKRTTKASTSKEKKEEVKVEEIKEEPKKEEKPKKKVTKKVKEEEVKEEKPEVVPDEETAEMLKLDEDEYDEDEDIYLTKTLAPIRRKKHRVRKVFRILFILALIAALGLLLFFKVIRPLYLNVLNSDPQKVFGNSIDYIVDKVEEYTKTYADADTEVMSLGINAKVSSNMEAFDTDTNVNYEVLYAYDAKNRRLLSDVSISRGDTYNNLFVVDNRMVFEKLSSYENFIKLDSIDRQLKDNKFYSDNKESFDNLTAYILPSEYAYYVKVTAQIVKDYLKEEMFDKKVSKLDVLGTEVSVMENTLTLKEEDLKKLKDAVQEKVNTDKVFKKVYDVYGNVIETDYKEVIINIYTKLNNSVIGFDIQEDGFRKIYVYKNEKNFDAYFNIDEKILTVKRENDVLKGSYGKNLTFEIEYKEDTDTKKKLEFKFTKDGKDYNGTLDLDINKDNKKYGFDLDLKQGNDYFKAYGSLSYKPDNNIGKYDLSNAIDPTMAEWKRKHDEFMASFSATDLYRKYESWYKYVTEPNLFTLND